MPFVLGCYSTSEQVNSQFLTSTLQLYTNLLVINLFCWSFPIQSIPTFQGSFPLFDDNDSVGIPVCLNNEAIMYFFGHFFDRFFPHYDYLVFVTCCVQQYEPESAWQREMGVTKIILETGQQLINGLVLFGRN